MTRKRSTAIWFAASLALAAADAQESSKEIYRKAISASRRAVKEKKYEETEQVGGGRSNFTELYNTGTVLIGFEFGIGHFFPPEEVVRAVRPIYMSPAGETVGKWRGQAGNKVVGKRQGNSNIHRTLKVKAKPGYAVSGISAKTGLLLDGMSVGFMRLTPRGLDAGDSYESDWIGSGGNKRPVLAGYTGDLVIGVFGDENGSDCVGLGLVVINEPMADLVDPTPADPAVKIPAPDPPAKEADKSAPKMPTVKGRK